MRSRTRARRSGGRGRPRPRRRRSARRGSRGSSRRMQPRTTFFANESWSVRSSVIWPALAGSAGRRRTRRTRRSALDLSTSGRRSSTTAPRATPRRHRSREELPVGLLVGLPPGGLQAVPMRARAGPRSSAGCRRPSASGRRERLRQRPAGTIRSRPRRPRWRRAGRPCSRDRRLHGRVLQHLHARVAPLRRVERDPVDPHRERPDDEDDRSEGREPSHRPRPSARVALLLRLNGHERLSLNCSGTRGPLPP